MIFGGFGDHFGSQNGTEMASEIDQKNNGFWDRFWKGSLPPKQAPRVLDTTDLDPRGGVKGRGLSGKGVRNYI